MQRDRPQRSALVNVMARALVPGTGDSLYSVVSVSRTDHRGLGCLLELMWLSAGAAVAVCWSCSGCLLELNWLSAGAGAGSGAEFGAEVGAEAGGIVFTVNN